MKNDDWFSKLSFRKEKGRQGEIADTIQNIILILENDEKLKDKLKHNLFTNLDVVMKDFGLVKNSEEHPYDDTDEASLFLYLESKYKMEKINEKNFSKALRMVFDRQSYHPVRDYFDSIRGTWDRKDRVSTLFKDFLVAEDNPAIAEVTEKWLRAAVCRIYKPGHKWDITLDIIGSQGTGKSTLLRKLAIKDEWYIEDLVDLTSRDSKMTLNGGFLIVELGENSALKKQDRNETKRALSATEDTVKLPYDRYATTFKRQNVFASTTNDVVGIYRDATGERRRAPILTKKKVDGPENYRVDAKLSVWDDLTEDYVNQIWAQIIENYDIAKVKEGTTQNLDLSKETKDYFETEIKLHKEDDPWTITISRFLEGEKPDNWWKKSVRDRQKWEESDEYFRKTIWQYAKLEKLDVIYTAALADIALAGKASTRSMGDSNRIATIMGTFPDWERVSTIRFADGTRTSGWRRLK